MLYDRYYENPLEMNKLLSEVDPVTKLQYQVFDINKLKNAFEPTADPLQRGPINPNDPYLTTKPRFEKFHLRILSGSEISN